MTNSTLVQQHPVLTQPAPVRQILCYERAARTLAGMLQSLLPLILILLGFHFWQSALKAREQAHAISRALCAQARVQLLDQTVALQRLGIARGADGWLHLRRRYRFELSIDGIDRHQGTLELCDGTLLSHSMPIPDDTPGSPASSIIDLQSHALTSTTRH